VLPRDQFLETVYGRSDWVPFDPLLMHLTAELLHLDYSNQYCENAVNISRCQIAAAKRFGLNHVHVCSDAYREANAWGIAVDLIHHTPMAKEGSKLDYTLIDTIETPDLNSNLRIQTRIEAIRLLKEHAPDYCVMGWIEAPFAELCCLFDMMVVMKDLLRKENSSLLHKWLDRLLPVQLEFAKMQIEAGADIIGAGDAAISQIGPRNYKQTTFETTLTLFNEIQKSVPVLYHTCGDNSGVDRHGNNMLELIVNTGAKVLDIDSQIDLSRAKSHVGEKICLRGNTNTGLLADQFCAISQIEEQIQRDVEIGSVGGKYIYAAGCEWPWSPLELVTRNLDIAHRIVMKHNKTISQKS
jgi:uroporphyrinogen-III decarboxylase